MFISPHLQESLPEGVVLGLLHDVHLDAAGQHFPCALLLAQTPGRRRRRRRQGAGGGGEDKKRQILGLLFCLSCALYSPSSSL